MTNCITMKRETHWQRHGYQISAFNYAGERECLLPTTSKIQKHWNSFWQTFGKEGVIENDNLDERTAPTLKEPRDSCSTLIRTSLGGVPGRAEVLFRATARLSPCPSPAHTSTKNKYIMNKNNYTDTCI